MIALAGVAFGDAGDGDGRSDPSARAAMAAALGIPSEWAYARQVHGTEVRNVARPGPAGEADALVTRVAGLSVAVATADCVPVALHGEGAAAIVHAGWRGAAAGVVTAARAVMAAAGGPPQRAAIGPCIGPCCYEVGDEVAARVAAASDESVIAPGPGRRPHLDLRAAVAGQLGRAGVAAIRVVEECTRCRPERLWSYRREGPGAGRNVALVWLDP